MILVVILGLAVIITVALVYRGSFHLTSVI